MNCPSRTDDDVLQNPTWNQNPPRFAADLTTCQDLNGIANARELGDADRLRSGAPGLRRCVVEEAHFQEKEKQLIALGKGAKGPQNGPCTRTIANVRNEHQAAINTAGRKMSQTTFRSWGRWILSVLCTSILISYMSRDQTWNPAGGKPVLATVSSNSATHHYPKRDGCAIGGAQPDYNLPFHVGGLFIILFVSSTACAFPILVIKFPRLRIPASFLFSAKHFGTGVLIATAFVHLLPTAFLSLSDPCLSSFWTEDYQAAPGAIMLASIFFVTIIEMVFSPGRHCCGGNEGVKGVVRNTVEEKENEVRTAPEVEAQMRRTYSGGSMQEQVRSMGNLRGRVTSISRTLSQYRSENQRLDVVESVGEESPAEDGRKTSNEGATEDPEASQPSLHMTPEQLHKKAVLQCFLLEMGILFHSIFIGMSLAVAIGNDFVVLLIAIIFHQTFEGLALGVRIAAISWPARSPQPWLMAVAYGCTTPLGQAIGIATHTLYSPDSEVGLLVVGIMNAISAGFLVFASLVELMSEDFLSDESWQVLRGKKRVMACLLVFSGAFLMSVVGAWA